MCHINRCESYGHLTTAGNQTAVIYYTRTHKHGDSNIHCNRGQKNTVTQIRWTSMMGNTCREHRLSCEQIPAVCLSADTHPCTHKHIEAQRHIYTCCHTPPWLVAISPWYFLGNTFWGHDPPSRKETKMLEKRYKNKHRNRQARKHAHTQTEINIRAAVSLKCPAISIFVPRGTCQTPVVTGSKTVPLLSLARSFMTWVRARAVCRIYFHMQKGK